MSEFSEDVEREFGLREPTREQARVISDMLLRGCTAQEAVVAAFSITPAKFNSAELRERVCVRLATQTGEWWHVFRRGGCE